MSFICGSSFHSQDQENDEFEVLWPFPSTSPKTPKRLHIFGNRCNKNATNPYADRGLDKFEALLADLDHKRQKIMTQKGSEDISMVKFVYRGPNKEVEPVIIKLRDQRKHDKTSLSQAPKTEQHQKKVALFEDKNGGKETEEEKSAKPASVCDKFKMKKINCEEWWKPSWYLPLFMMLILVLLMFSGRSFAILCISLGWYLVPIINETLHIQSINRRRRRRSGRKITEKVNKKQT